MMRRKCRSRQDMSATWSAQDPDLGILRLRVSRMGKKVDLDDLVDATAIAERLGLSSSSVVRDWLRRHPSFPEPVARFGPVAVYLWPEVAAWARATKRLE